MLIPFGLTKHTELLEPNNMYILYRTIKTKNYSNSQKILKKHN